mmetsp:Transcript_75959/g.245995  ORF Transcript_75959/g.245995 Transcript_75959/m.245995 type:complete len:307 (+) Transcript_75959:585-1505(+)
MHGPPADVDGPVWSALLEEHVEGLHLVLPKEAAPQCLRVLVQVVLDHPIPRQEDAATVARLWPGAVKQAHLWADGVEHGPAHALQHGECEPVELQREVLALQLPEDVLELPTLLLRSPVEEAYAGHHVAFAVEAVLDCASPHLVLHSASHGEVAQRVQQQVWQEIARMGVNSTVLRGHVGHRPVGPSQPVHRALHVKIQNSLVPTDLDREGLDEVLVHVIDQHLHTKPAALELHSQRNNWLDISAAAEGYEHDPGLALLLLRMRRRLPVWRRGLLHSLDGRLPRWRRRLLWRRPHQRHGSRWPRRP